MWSHHFHEWGSTNSTDLPRFVFSSVGQTWRRDCTTRKREATYAPSVYDAFAAGLAPVPWKSEYAADWFTKTPPSRFSLSATPTSRAADRISPITASEVEYTEAVIAPWSCTVLRKREIDSS